MSPASKLAILRDRAQMFSEVRRFFEKRGVLEVDVPIMGKGAPIDAHIDVMAVPLQGGERGFLHTSPEYAMKRLLSLGLGDIFQMCHVFRDGEVGHLHNPEFTMIEWYRMALSFDALIAETVSLIRLFLGEVESASLTYRQALLNYTDIDYTKASIAQLLAAADRHQIHLPKDAPHWDRDTILQFLFSFIVEPRLASLTIIRDYPSTQAALAKTSIREDELVAERFEIYYKGVELANGFHELTDPVEQRKRLHESNAHRLKLGKDELPIDEEFLQALESGIPDCCGVAVGFDRLLQLKHNKKHLAEVLPFSWT